MNRIVLIENSPNAHVSNNLLFRMWNMRDKVQTTGLISPMQNQEITQYREVECFENDIPDRLNYTGSEMNVMHQPIKTGQRHRNYPIWKLWRSFLPTVHAQENRNTDSRIPSSADGRNEETSILYKVTDDEVNAYIAAQTGMDRLRLLFGSYDELYGKRQHPALETYTTQVTFMILLTFPFFAYGASQRESQRFKSSNIITKYDTQFTAKRAHLDAMVFTGLRSGIRWSFKIGITLSLMLGISRLISIYRNKSGIIDIVGGAGLGFGIVSLRNGPKGFVGGTILGSLVAVIPAMLLLGVQKWTNTTQEEQHFEFMHDLLQKRKKLECQALEETYVIEESKDHKDTNELKQSESDKKDTVETKLIK